MSPSHYLVGVDTHGERCACGAQMPRLVEHFGDMEFARWGVERRTAA